MTTATATPPKADDARKLLKNEVDTFRTWLHLVIRHQDSLRLEVGAVWRGRKTGQQIREMWELHRDALLRAAEGRLYYDLIVRLALSILWMNDMVGCLDRKRGTKHALSSELEAALHRAHNLLK